MLSRIVNLAVTYCILISMSMAALGAMAHPDGFEPPDALHRRVLHELADFTDWLEANHAKGYIGEIGWPDDRRGGGLGWNGGAGGWFKAAESERLGGAGLG